MGCGIIINLFEGIKRFLNGDKDKSSLKLYKDSNRTCFLENVTLGNMSSDYLNELISILVDWYRIRIPDSIFIRSDNGVFVDKQNIGYRNYKNMSFEQLLNRNNDLHLLKCNYRDNNVYAKNELSLEIYTKTGLLNRSVDKVCTIFADRKSGRIKRIKGDYLLPEEIKNCYKEYNLNELLDLLNEEHIESLNYDSLINCVVNRENDLNIRDKIIDIVCIELVRSNECDFGYFRAFTFLKEINNFLGLKLNSSYLNKLVDKSITISDKDKDDNYKVKLKKQHH